MIDPVADTTQAEGDREAYREDICNFEESISILSRKKKNSEQYSEKPTMKTHASLPDWEDLYRVRYEECRIIENNIPDASSEDHPEEYVQ